MAALLAKNIGIGYCYNYISNKNFTNFMVMVRNLAVYWLSIIGYQNKFHICASLIRAYANEL